MELDGPVSTMLMPKPWWDPNESESDYWDEEDTDAPAPVPPSM